MLPGTRSRALVRFVLCALSGFAAPGGPCRLAPVCVPSLWPVACLVAPRGALRLVRSGRSRCPGRFSRRRGAFPHPGGFRPRIYLAPALGKRRPAENPAHCVCPWPLPRQGRRARSASYPFRAPRWHCPWRVLPASVLGCVRCSGLRVWTWSLSRPVSCTVRLPTGDSAGAPGLFLVDADTSHFESEDATPGSRECVRVRGLYWPGGPGRPPGRLLMRLTFSVAALSFCLAWSPLGWGSPFPVVFFAFPFFFFFFSFLAPPLSSAFLVSGPGCPGHWRSLPLPGPRSLSLFFFLLLAPLLSLFFSGFRPWVSWVFALPAPPPPPGLRCFFSFRCFSSRSSGFGVCLLPACLACCLFPSGLFCFFPPPFPFSFCFSRLFLPPPIPPCLFCGSPAAGLAVCSSFFFVLCCAVGSLLVPCPWPCRRPVLFTLWRAVLFWSAVPCAVLCCVPGCGAAPRCCASLCPALSCFVPCCVVALLWCRCLLCCALRRCPSPCGSVLSGAVFCGFAPRCVLCAVSVLPWCVGACCCSPLCFLLCVCAPCVLGCRAARSLSSPICAVLRSLVPGASVRCCVLCLVLWSSVVWCWVWLPIVVLWWRVSVSVSLSGRVAYFSVVGVVCCGALLPCVLFRCALLWCGAVLSCSAVFWRCCLCLLFLLLCPVVLFCHLVTCCWALLCVVLCCVCLSSFQKCLQNTKLNKLLIF